MTAPEPPTAVAVAVDAYLDAAIAALLAAGMTVQQAKVVVGGRLHAAAHRAATTRAAGRDARARRPR